MTITKSEAISHLYGVLPYSNQIKELDIESEPNAIRFQWRSCFFRVSFEFVYEVETVGNGVLISDDVSILLRTLLNRAKEVKP